MSVSFEISMKNIYLNDSISIKADINYSKYNYIDKLVLKNI